MKNNEKKCYVLRMLCSYVTGQETTVTVVAIQLDFDNKICGHFKLSQIKNSNSQSELTLFVRSFLHYYKNYKGKILNICFCEKFLINFFYESGSQVDLDEYIDILLILRKELKEKNKV